MPSEKKLVKTNSSSLKQDTRQKVISTEIIRMHNFLANDEYQQDPNATLLRMIQENMPKT